METETESIGKCKWDSWQVALVYCGTVMTLLLPRSNSASGTGVLNIHPDANLWTKSVGCMLLGVPVLYTWPKQVL